MKIFFIYDHHKTTEDMKFCLIFVFSCSSNDSFKYRSLDGENSNFLTCQ